MKSKEDDVLELFFNYPTKHWHFSDIKKETKIADSKIALWLDKLKKGKIILKIKPTGKMPYYLGNHECPQFRAKKKLFSLNLLQKSGFIEHLLSLKKAKTIIIFGSIIRSDWSKDSDIDIFIYGTDKELNYQAFSSKLDREIQVFCANSKKDFEKFSEGLINNMISGYPVKGTLDFLEVKCKLKD
jgi:hypothetical protein